MNVDPPPVFAREPRVIPDGTMLFDALQKIASGVGGRTRFIYRIIFRWSAILWEGEMFQYLSELDLDFGYFRRSCLKGFQVNDARY